jgi:hypothetical protein
MADVEHFKDRMERENYRFEITELGGVMAKNDRIRRLIPWFEQGRLPPADHSTRPITKAARSISSIVQE